MLLDNVVATVRHRFAHAPSDAVPIIERQSGVIPYSIVGSTPVFLLVTSRRTGRWIFPKGRLTEGMEPWQSAEREAYQEAGVEGVVDPVPAGSFRTWKTRGVRRFAIEVDMYPFRVEHQLDKWRETGERHRHWVIRSEVARLILEKRLVELVEIVAARVGSAQVPAADEINA